MKGIGGHQSHKVLKEEWLTPPDILRALGPFDLDPCAPVDRPWDMAHRHYTIIDDGLSKPWEGRIWCNPPYGEKAWRWLERCAHHGNAVALVFARTETAGFFRCVWERADALLFIRSRLHFHHLDGSRAAFNGGAPSVLIAYGDNNVSILLNSGIGGYHIDLRRGGKLCA